MSIRVAINGYGRIGRNVLRAHYENPGKHDIQIVAINDLGDVRTCAHLTQYDTAHGRFAGTVSVDGDDMLVNGDRIRFFSTHNITELPWAELGVDVVLECTGVFTSKKSAASHIQAGAQKVLISAVGDADVDATIVYGVNHNILKATDTVVSNASCTVNCLAPVIKPLNDQLRIVSGLITTLHAYTKDQVLTDVCHNDIRRARSATMSTIPITTGAPAALSLVLPEMKNKLDGLAIRVPTINVAAVDLTFTTLHKTTVDEVNAILETAAEASGGILGYNTLPLVSIDFNHNPASATFDATQTKVCNGTLVKVLVWYDNEWGFSNRMLDTTVVMMNAK